MFEGLWQYYKKNNLCHIQHKRSARYEILLGFIDDICGQAETFKELLVYDYYLRENAKTRPVFAGKNALGKEKMRQFYEEEVIRHRYLKGYEAYDKNQMRKMTHLEYFPVLNKTVLFDYMHRNPINYEAYTCEIII